MELIKPVLITGLSLFLLAMLIPAVSFSSWATLIIAAIILTLLQFTLKPILKLLFLPINIITLGIFGWIINAFILWLAAYLVPGFQLNSFMLLGISFSGLWALIVLSFLLSLIQSVVDSVL